MILESILAIIVAGITQMAQQAGQSIQQWVNSPQGQRTINEIIKQFGHEALRQLFKKLKL